MLNQEFSVDNFLKLTKKSDPRKYKLGKDKNEYRMVLKECADVINKDGYSVSKLKGSKYNHGVVYTPGTVTDVYAFKKANNNLKRLFGVKAPNRSSITRQVKTLLLDKTPMTILRLDIKKFYESVPVDPVLEHICNSSLPSFETKKIVSRLFSSCSLKTVGGLPRGIDLSNTLAEIYLQDFDRKVRKIDGVYYYVRYVDDILVFCFKEHDDVLKKMRQFLPMGLDFNESKTKVISINEEIVECKNNKKVYSVSFDYLGYNFSLSYEKDVSKNRRRTTFAYKAKRLSIGVAKKKINKFKTKLVLAFLAFEKNNDFKLLRDRVMFLTSNYYVQNNYKKVFWEGTSNHCLKAGVFYNYDLIDSGRVSDFKKLDRFLISLIWSKNNKTISSGRIGLNDNQRRIISGYSFVKGFGDKKMVSFGLKRFHDINVCWKYI